MTTRKEYIQEQRLAKLDRIRSRKVDPYPSRYQRTHQISEAIALFEQQEKAGIAEAPPVTVAGRIIASRDMGKASFMDIRDGSGKIQLFFSKDKLGEEYQFLADLDLGDFIGVTGKLWRTRTKEITVQASGWVLLSKSLLPLPDKWHGLTDVEKRYRQRYLDLLTSEEVRNIFRTRSRAISSLRRFLDGRGFLEVETPVLQAVAAGAMAKPFVTHHEALDRDLYLRIALELYLKRLIIGGMDKVYEIGRVFRNEGISTKHNPEFTMLETYEAYADYNAVMKMVEEMVSTVAQDVLGAMKAGFAGTTIDLTPPWPRMTLREATLKYSGIDFEEHPEATDLRQQMLAHGMAGVDEKMSWGRLLDQVVSTFVEPKLIQPTFLMDYPVEMSPLAKRKPDNPKLVERFELFVGGIEMANSFTELNDPMEQRQRFLQQEKERAAYGDEETDRLDNDFLLAMEHGMPPTGGLGVGVDRLVMLLTDQQSIREVILFPQLRTV
ncbi:MAG: lysine--tRNA ligase [Dehalococcoidia bacterium]|nr:lysine--tRNA ligase [Dehalococcoidia bacterium]